MKYLGYSICAVFVAVFGVIAWAWQSVVWYPPVVDVIASCESEAAAWQADQPLKVMSFNVQYMASKNYVFFYDVDGGPDSKPSRAHTEWTLDRVAEIIRDENPDVLLLQEINDEHDSRTHYVDQVTQLQQRLGELAYPCQANAHYWQAGMVLHPNVLGAVSMKLTTLSRYPMSQARRHQLPLMDNDPLTTRFYFQRAILESHIESETGETIALLNTHFDAWGEGSDLMARQVAVTLDVIDSLEASNTPWLFGGDLNSLPLDSKRQWRRLVDADVAYYDEETALAPLYERYGAIPSIDDLTGDDVSAWLTHYSNDPAVSGPDRTIDYLFFSRQWQLDQSYVRQHDTLDVSDHLPVVGVFSLERAGVH